MGCSRIVKNILRNVAIDQSFSVLVINCLHFVTNSYKVVANIYDSLRITIIGANVYISYKCAVSSFDNQRPHRQHDIRKKQVGVIPTVPTIASLNDTEGRGLASIRDLSTQADEATGTQKVLV